jgi:hypothetical protein
VEVLYEVQGVSGVVILQSAWASVVSWWRIFGVNMIHQEEIVCSSVWSLYSKVIRLLQQD